MRQSDFTDEEILTNMKDILSNPLLRKCEQCANADEDCTFCSQFKKPIAKWMYAGHCKFYETHEERIIRKTRESLEQHEKTSRKANYMLTMSLNSVEVGMYFLEDFIDRVEKEYTIAEKKKVGDLISKVLRTKQVSANNYLNSGCIPVIDQSRNYIAGYTDDIESLIEVTIPYIVFGDHTRVLKYVPFSFAKGADGTQLIMSNDLERMPQSLFYNSLIEIDLSNYSYARHFKYLKDESILVPSKDIAQRYDKVVSQHCQSIQKSRDQIRHLTEARDRLLYKLINKI
jgi:hypothetical protein